MPRSVSSPCFTPWGQEMTHHPHVHCVIPGDGL
ncbi:transposase [Agrobacterium sp. S2/73]|nr:transposase [Agrobacterium sp. S2/73]QXZ75968.1 transposase [Agrobacterium sp. S7/73]QYA17021.1 transposase [Rhizobium sp. AB2/73]UEQ85406.1 transposase [Rhizobium sp. AB2/73]